MGRRFLLVATLLAAGAAGFWVWQQRSASASEETEPSTVAVQRGTVERTVLASGVIEAKSLVSVGARVSGQVDTLAVNLGDRVKQGDLIAQLESLDQQNAILQAKADLAQISAQIASNIAEQKLAELSLARTRSLAEKTLASTETLETAQADLDIKKASADALQAQKQRAELAVSQATVALERTRITAPSDGTVVAIVTGQGQTVNASSATPTIVKIANLDQMVIKAEISEADVVHVAPGQKAKLTLLGEPDQPFPAVLSGIEPAPDSIETSDVVDTTKAIYYNGILDVDNPDGRLRIGMTAEVTVYLDRADDVLTLPSSVIFNGDDGKPRVEVWDAAAKKRSVRVVTVGLDNAITAEIKDGVSEGDRIVSDRTSSTDSAALKMRSRPPGLGF